MLLGRLCFLCTGTHSPGHAARLPRVLLMRYFFSIRKLISLHLFLRLLNPILEQNNSILGKTSNLGGWWLIFCSSHGIKAVCEPASNGQRRCLPAGQVLPRHEPTSPLQQCPSSHGVLSSLFPPQEASCSDVAFHCLSVVLNLNLAVLVLFPTHPGDLVLCYLLTQLCVFAFFVNTP